MGKREAAGGLDEELLLAVLRHIREGNLSERMPPRRGARAGRIAAEMNAILTVHQRNVETLAKSAECLGCVERVISAVAEGDLSHSMTADGDALALRGQYARTARAVNAMVQRLRAFSSEVTRVAREVGTEGRLGGHAYVPGAAGTWKDLTDNVNRLAANLTSQVRAIAEVTTAVTQGDLTRSIGVEARGEVALLKDKINEMIRNLRETTEKNTEQDWLKTHLARHTRILQGHRDLTTVSRLILSEVAPLISAQHGAIYLMGVAEDGHPVLRLRAAYAATQADPLPAEFRLGDGLVGQCAADRRRILIAGAPTDSIRIASGLLHGPPLSIVVLPVLFENQVKAVVELASFQPFSPTHLDFLDQLTESIGTVLHSIEANMRTEELLQQSQVLFAEAQEASRSKSAFLSMAAHELRTPLSVVTGYLSMLQDGSLPPERWAGSIDILATKAKALNKIVNDLLTAARMEAGTVPAQVLTIDLRDAAHEALARARPQATLSQAQLSTELPPHPVLVEADREHLARVLDNLLNNALTYCTGRPWVLVRVSDVGGPQLAVEDHGVGIPAEMSERIFERFFRIDDPRVGPQPGTGLGLYIGRELAERHGGSLTLERSEVGKGSKFVLRLPPAARRGFVHTLLTNTPGTVGQEALGVEN